MIPKAGWRGLVALFFTGWVFLYGDRTILGPALPGIGEQWQLSGSQLGLISSVFFFTYTLFQIPAAVLADRFGRKAVLVPGYLLFAVTTALMGLAPSYPSLLLWSALGGLGQSTYYAAQYSLSSAAIPQRHLGLGSAVINSGMAVGSSLGVLAASWLGAAGGASWRLPFWVMAAPTALVGLAIALFVPEQPRRRIEAPLPQGTGGGAWNPVILLIAVANFCSLYGFFLILTWLPYYLRVVRVMPPEQVRWLASVIWLLSIPSAILFSSLSDRLIPRRTTVIALLATAALALATIPYAATQGQLLAALLLYGVAGKLTVDPIIVAFVADSVPARASAGTFGFLNFAGMLGSVLAPSVTGMILDTRSELAWAFWIGAVLLGAGVLCVGLTFRYAGGAIAPGWVSSSGRDSSAFRGFAFSRSSRESYSESSSRASTPEPFHESSGTPTGAGRPR